MNWRKIQQGVAKGCKFSLKDVDEGCVYEFRVAAENKAGIGANSDTVETRAKTPIGK